MKPISQCVKCGAPLESRETGRLPAIAPKPVATSPSWRCAGRFGAWRPWSSKRPTCGARSRSTSWLVRDLVWRHRQAAHVVGGNDTKLASYGSHTATTKLTGRRSSRAARTTRISSIAVSSRSRTSHPAARGALLSIAGAAAEPSAQTPPFVRLCFFNSVGAR
jgi:hypothetical protein